MGYLESDSTDDLELRVLGPIEVWRGADRQALPRSKKTRALLAYLAITGRSHRRERLCDLLWDITDDPKGALRWSLSRIRKAIVWDRPRITSDRSEVAFETDGMRIDALALSRCVRAGLGSADTETLCQMADLPRGVFLEGLELPDFMNFDAWCVAQREQFRNEHCAVLAEVVARLSDDPLRAVEYARTWTEEDSFSVDAHGALLRLLVAAGRTAEAEARFENCQRLFNDLGASGLADIEAVWRSLNIRKGQASPAPVRTTPALPPERTPSLWPFVGRRRELEQLEAGLEESKQDERPRIALVTAEPGGGKTRLAERLMDRAASSGWSVFSGKAYEAESSRPYGPWLDALESDLGELLDAVATDANSQTALFSAIVKRLAERSVGTGALIVLDNFQWFDRDSIELLHVVVRSYAGGPLCIVLLARAGELPDNELALRVMRGLRRDAHAKEIKLGLLSQDDIAGLLAEHPTVDADAVFAASGGNALYAIEFARAQATRTDGPPSSLIDLVRDRVDQLPDHATDVLKWGAVLGHSMGINRLEALCSHSVEVIVDALECLELHALLRIDVSKQAERYVFAHDVVRQAVYSELSPPRRRLMHKKIAALLAANASDAFVATEIAYHAGQAGEALPGVEACLVAGRQSLRVFANGDAETLARRGLRLAEELPDAERITFSLELLHLQYSARTPDRSRAVDEVRALADHALDLGLTHAARLGFQTLSFLRWESSSMAAAHDNIMQAERVSRSAEPTERCAALSQAAKCLVLLERKLNQAEAFLMEVEGLSARGAGASATASLARGMLAAHRGDAEQALGAFGTARELARQQGDRLTEFAAIEQWAIFELDRNDGDAALALSESLADLGARVRPGVEAPASRAVLQLARLACGDSEAEPELAAELQALRTLDDKYYLSIVLSREAYLLLRLQSFELAAERANEALATAKLIGRPSEEVYAHAVLAAGSRAKGDREEEARHLRLIDERMTNELSWSARQRVAEIRTTLCQTSSG